MTHDGNNGLRPAHEEKKKHPEVQVEPLPRRRTFTAEYKMSILRETDAQKGSGQVGSVLRREGLFSSHLTTWRRERDEGSMAALKKKRGRKSTHNPLADENERLRRENVRLQNQLEQAKVIIDVQKKVASLLGIPLDAPNLDENDS